MKVLYFWLARAALTFVAWIALFFAGWQHWTSVLGAAVIAWLITYLMFGSLYDAAGKQLDAFIARRFGSGRAAAQPAADADAADEDAEVESQS